MKSAICELRTDFEELKSVVELSNSVINPNTTKYKEKQHESKNTISLIHYVYRGKSSTIQILLKLLNHIIITSNNARGSEY